MAKKNTSTSTGKSVKKPTCGLVMPISEIDGCDAEHWEGVRQILSRAVESIENPKFEVDMVSNSESVDVIQKTIVQNLDDCDIIVCDVSCRNPNVMFELGMRLAFDKPVVIVKDNVTSAPFDFGIIQYIEYPRDLNFIKVESFQKEFIGKVKGTYRAARADSDYSPFLKHFNKERVAAMAEVEISGIEAIIGRLDAIDSRVGSVERMLEDRHTRRQYYPSTPDIGWNLSDPVESRLLRRILRERIEEYIEVTGMVVILDFQAKWESMDKICAVLGFPGKSKRAKEILLNALNEVRGDRGMPPIEIE